MRETGRQWMHLIVILYSIDSCKSKKIAYYRTNNGRLAGPGGLLGMWITPSQKGWRPLWFNEDDPCIESSVPYFPNGLSEGGCYLRNLSSFSLILSISEFQDYNLHSWVEYFEAWRKESLSRVKHFWLNYSVESKSVSIYWHRRSSCTSSSL